MAQGIDVPGVQTQQVPYQAPNPLPFVSQALDRQQNQQKIFLGQLDNLGDVVNAYTQQRLNNQMNLLAARTTAIRQIGPNMANQVYGGYVSPNGNTPIQQPDPLSGFQDPNAPPAPSQPQQTPPVSPPQTAGTPDASGAPVVSPAIALSHNMGLQSATSKRLMNPDIPTQVGSLASQMPQYMSQGELGKEKIQELLNQQQGLAAQGTAQKTQNDIAMQPTEAALKNQQLLNAKAEIPMKLGTQQAEVAKAVAPKMADIKQLQSTFDKINQINSSPNNKSIPFTGDLGAKYATQNPNTKSPWAQNQYNAEQTAGVGAGIIEKLAEGRYNHEQAQVIAKSFFPTGNQLGTLQAKDKLDRFQNYINQMKSGQIDQANAQLDAIAGGGFNPQSLGNPAAFPGTQNPQIHNVAIQWAQANPNDPRAKSVLAKAQSSLGAQ